MMDLGLIVLQIQILGEIYNLITLIIILRQIILKTKIKTNSFLILIPSMRINSKTKNNNLTLIFTSMIVIRWMMRNFNDRM